MQNNEQDSQFGAVKELNMPIRILFLLKLQLTQSGAKTGKYEIKKRKQEHRLII